MSENLLCPWTSEIGGLFWAKPFSPFETSNSCLPSLPFEFCGFSSPLDFETGGFSSSFAFEMPDANLPGRSKWYTSNHHGSDKSNHHQRAVQFQFSPESLPFFGPDHPGWKRGQRFRHLNRLLVTTLWVFRHHTLNDPNHTFWQIASPISERPRCFFQMGGNFLRHRPFRKRWLSAQKEMQTCNRGWYMSARISLERASRICSGQRNPQACPALDRNSVREPPFRFSLSSWPLLSCH